MVVGVYMQATWSRITGVVFAGKVPFTGDLMETMTPASPPFTPSICLRSAPAGLPFMQRGSADIRILMGGGATPLKEILPVIFPAADCAWTGAAPPARLKAAVAAAKTRSVGSRMGR